MNRDSDTLALTNLKYSDYFCASIKLFQQCNIFILICKVTIDVDCYFYSVGCSTAGSGLSAVMLAGMHRVVLGISSTN